MNKRFILYIFLMFAASQLKSQQNTNFVSAGVDYHIGSSAISNNFTNAFLFSNRIDSTEKAVMFNGLKHSNSLGTDILQKVEFSYIFDTLFSCKNFGISAGVYNNFHLDMNFSDDLMQLFFSGNKAFAGKTANLTGASLNMLQYQVFRLGVVKQIKSDFATQTFGISLGFVNGSDYANISFKNASIYTSPDATYIDLSANYQAFLSDTSSSGMFTGNGKGASINFSYSYECIHNNVFYAEISDLGFIKWNKQTINSHKDTSIHFEGVVIDDILNINENIFGNGNADSIKQNYIYSGTTSELIVPLPFKLELGYQRKINQKTTVFAILKKRFHSNFDMQYIAGARFHALKNTSVAFNINLGGYSAAYKPDDMNLGLELKQKLAKIFEITIGSNSLNGFIFPNSVSSQGIYGSLTLNLK